MDIRDLNKNVKNWKIMEKEELIHQVSPSHWSVDHSKDTVIPEYIKNVTQDLKDCRDEIPWKSYVSSEDPHLELDFYGLDLDGGCPIFIYIHGGYWQELNKDLVGGLMGPLYRRGVCTAVLPYPLAPEEQVKNMVLIIKAGLAKVLELAEERGASSVVAGGWSAGAQLTVQALSSLSHRLIKGVVCISGVFDLQPLVPTYVNEPLKLTSEEAWNVSPLKPNNVTAYCKRHSSAKLLVVVAQHDTDLFKTQAREYVQVMLKEGLQVELLEVTRADHFNVVSNLAKDGDYFTIKLTDFIHNC